MFTSLGQSTFPKVNFGEIHNIKFWVLLSSFSFLCVLYMLIKIYMYSSECFVSLNVYNMTMTMFVLMFPFPCFVFIIFWCWSVIIDKNMCSLSHWPEVFIYCRCFFSWDGYSLCSSYFLSILLVIITFYDRRPCNMEWHFYLQSSK